MGHGLWASHLLSENLGVSICKMGTGLHKEAIIVPPAQHLAHGLSDTRCSLSPLLCAVGDGTQHARKKFYH